MRLTLVSLGIALVIVCLCKGTTALGGAFGARKGGSFVKYGQRPPSFNLVREKEKPAEELLEELLDLDGECVAKKCTSTDQCCKGTVCVAIDESLGTCLPVFQSRKGESCITDNDCGIGLICRNDQCQSENRNDECDTSNECDVGKGLCCQLLRRHRQAPRKACVYYQDPRMCIGNVSNSPKLTDSQKDAIKARLG